MTLFRYRCFITQYSEGSVVWEQNIYRGGY